LLGEDLPWENSVGERGFLAATCCDLVVVTHIIIIMPIAMEVIAKDIGAFAAAEGAVARDMDTPRGGL